MGVLGIAIIVVWVLGWLVLTALAFADDPMLGVLVGLIIGPLWLPLAVVLGPPWAVAIVVGGVLESRREKIPPPPFHRLEWRHESDDWAPEGIPSKCCYGDWSCLNPGRWTLMEWHGSGGMGTPYCDCHADLIKAQLAELVAAS